LEPVQGLVLGLAPVQALVQVQVLGREQVPVLATGEELVKGLGLVQVPVRE
jgi:hypothetical protein